MGQMQTLIDWNRIADLLDQIGRDDLIEIVDIFLDETAAMVAEMAVAKLNDMPGRIHAVKSNATTLGFRTLGDLCRKAEWSLARGDAVDREGIELCFELSCEVLLRDLPDQMRKPANVVSSVMSV